MVRSRSLSFASTLLFLLSCISLHFTPKAFAQATFSPIVTVGPGYVDCYTRQVVRTAGDVVYVVLNASGFDGGTALRRCACIKVRPRAIPPASRRWMRRTVRTTA